MTTSTTPDRGDPELHGRPTRGLAALGAAVLAIGVATYVFDRSPGHAWLLPWSVEVTRGALPAELSGVLPTVCHAFTFGLLTALCLRPGRGSTLIACGGWLIVNALFEAGQHPALAALVTAALPLWLAAVPVLDHLPSYLLGGTFDWRDLAAGALGAALAAVTLASADNTTPWRSTCLQ